MHSQTIGEMAEWSIAAVLKTVEGHTSGGSNPSLSATNAENQQVTNKAPQKAPEFCFFGRFFIENAGEATFWTNVKRDQCKKRLKC